MTTDRQKRIQYLVYIKSYINSLNSIIKEVEVNRSSLLSLDETEKIRYKSKGLDDLHPYTFTIDFSEKTTDKFKSYINTLYKNNSSGIYVWIEGVNECGIYKAASLKSINFDFLFRLDCELASFTTTDFNGELLLDWYIDDDTNKKVIEIEARGKDWSKVAY